MSRKIFDSAIFGAIALIFSNTPVAFAQPGAALHLEQKMRAAQQRGPIKAPTPTSCELITPDFVVTGSSSSSTVNEHCFPSDGNNNFGPRSEISRLSIVDGLDVADIDDDGDNDFLACDGLTGEVYLYTQGPANIFVPTTVATGVTPGGGSFLCTYLRVADFNSDGLTDFVVGDHLVAGGTFVYLQGPGTTFSPFTPGLNVSWASPSGAQCNCLFGVAAGDADLDGNDDVLLLGFTGTGAGEVWFYQGIGNGDMAPPVFKFDVGVDFPGVANPTGLALFDFDGDSDLDLVVGGSANGNHYVYINDGFANFSAPTGAAFTTNNFTGIDAYDVDGDQNEDLLLVDWSSQQLLLSRNLGSFMAAPLAVGVVDGPSLGVGAPETPERVGFELDHFKCYPAQAEERVAERVGLSDQFGAGNADVIETKRFCNAVAKIHDEKLTPIQNEDAHLEMLTIQAEGKTPSRVAVTNQFGEDQKLDVGRAAFLAVPTKKIIPGDHPFPERLDHFKCYDVVGQGEDRIVALKDQFGFEPEVVTLNPSLLCNPTKKEHNGVTTLIENPRDHLVCYDLANTEQLFDFTLISNQFGERGLQLEKADLLCLPSKKRVLE